MISRERVDHFKRCVADARKHLGSAESYRDQLIAWQKEGTWIVNKDGEDLLTQMIHDTDFAAKQYHKIVIRMEAYLGRAEAGENV